MTANSNRPKSGSKLEGTLAGIAATLLVVALLALVPTPYYLISPGTAVDLGPRVTVEGRTPPHRHYYLTDVTVLHASALLLALALVPGTRVVRRGTILPPGETLRSYDRVLGAAMDQSQRVAAYVAERAAGYAMPAPEVRIVVAGFTAASHARGTLRVGDRLVRVGTRPVRRASDVAVALARVRRGAPIAVAFARDGRVASAVVPTLRTPLGTRLGIALVSDTVIPDLAVPVRYSLDGVEGSSGGLMFALTIYAQLRGEAGAATPVAGTGTIGADGAVGRIEGTRQKLIAAERAGARTFLVPRANYPDVRDERGIAVIPVDTFASAIAAIDPATPSAPKQSSVTPSSSRRRRD